MNEQKIPQKMKKRSNELKKEDKEKCEKYYSDVKDFIDRNNKLVENKNKEIKYIFKFDKSCNFFTLDHNDYDHQSFESFGYYEKNKKLFYLSIEEAFYLKQIGIISFQENFDFNSDDLIKINLYSYLKRSGKVPFSCKILSLLDVDKNDIVKELDKYFILIKDFENYKRHKIESIIYQHDAGEKLNFLLIQKVIENAKNIVDLFKKMNKLKDDFEIKYELIICFTQGISLTFLKVDNKIDI